MPSDLPPNQSQPPAGPGPAGAAGIERPEVRSAAGEAGERMAAGTTAPAGADVRRYGASGRKGQVQSAISNSFALAMIMAFLVVAVVMIRKGPSLVQPERVLPGAPIGVSAPATATAPENTTTSAAPAGAPSEPARLSISPNSPLAQAYGMSALNTASRQARRIGQATGVAAECGVQTRHWVNDVRDVVAQEQAEQYPAFEEDARVKEMLKRFIASEYIAGQNEAPAVIAASGKQAACDNIRYSPDYRAAVNAAEQAGIR